MKHSMLYPRATQTRRIADLDGMWKFKFDEKSEGKESNWKDGLQDYIMMPVPASFCDFFTDKQSREYTGEFWYETDFFVPGEWQDKNIDIRFGSVTHRGRVFVNGQYITEHEGGFLPFTARINDVVKWNETNKVVVHCSNELGYTTLPAGKTITLENGRKMSKPFFDFYNYSGIQRPVKLVATPKEEIVDFTLNYKIKGADAIVEYSVVTSGNHDVKIEIYDEQNQFVVEGTCKNGSMKIKNAKLWNVLNSYLYKFKLTIIDGNTIIDDYYDEIGIRTVEVKGTDILINGNPVYLKGFGKHEDYDIIGRGFSQSVMKRDFELMKWVGANSFRTSHYPYSEEYYQMADREGFMVIDEVPAVGFMESLMNFMDASSGKTTAWFDKETTPELKSNHLAQVEEMITRDKNHACVIAWSLLNEPDTLTESARPYFKDIFDYARKLDVQKRPRTFALLMSSTPDKCMCYQFSDIISLNRYFGWYSNGGYEISEAETLFRNEMDAWKDKNLNKPFIFTEYGADTYAGEHKLPSVMWSEEYQVEYLKMFNSVFDSYDFVKGEQLWAFADFQTTEGIMRVNGNKKGIFTRQRQPKFAAYYTKKRWDNLPLNYKQLVDDK